MKQYNLSKAVDKGRLLSKIYAELLKLRQIIVILSHEKSQVDRCSQWIIKQLFAGKLAVISILPYARE